MKTFSTYVCVFKYVYILCLSVYDILVESTH